MHTQSPLLRSSLVWLSLGVSLGVVGCFDEPQPSATTDAGSTTGDDGTTTSTAPTTADETADAQTVTIRGTVTTSVGDPASAPVDGVKVELVGDPAVSAISGSDGRFELEGVPAGNPAYLSTSASGTYLGTVVGIDVMFSDFEVTVPLYSRAEAQARQEQIMMQGAAEPLDSTRGAIFAVSSHANTTIELAPMPPDGTYFAIDSGGVPLLDANASAFILLPTVIFYNLPPGPAGTVEVSASHPMRTCTVPLPSPPVLPDHATVLIVTCV